MSQAGKGEKGRWGLWASSPWSERFFSICRISWSISKKDVLLELAASLVDKTVKKPPAVEDNWLQSLG